MQIKSTGHSKTAAKAADSQFMQLQVLLPSKIFATYDQVERIVLETPEGAYGILVNRRDCVGALEPGILSYIIHGQKPQYLAVDEGIVVKVGHQVRISVRNVHSGANLSDLKHSVQTEFISLSEQEREVRAVLARLESGFMRGFRSLNSL